MRFERADPERLSDADQRSWHRCLTAVVLADLPDDPPYPLSRAVAILRPLAEGGPGAVWLGRDGTGEVVAAARFDPYGSENAHLAEVMVWVRPDARRRGIGRALFGLGVRESVASGRTTLAAFGQTSEAIVGFAAAVGLERAQSATRRVLDVATAAPDLAELAAGSKARRDGFSLVRWTGSCPEEYLDAFATARTGMNDEPLGDLEYRPIPWTAARVREREAALGRPGRTTYVMCVREDATGALAGLTQLDGWDGGVRACQDETTVRPAYRGRGFGLWLKAAMVEWLRTERPEVTGYETFNATENRKRV